MYRFAKSFRSNAHSRSIIRWNPIISNIVTKSLPEERIILLNSLKSESPKRVKFDQFCKNQNVLHALQQLNLHHATEIQAMSYNQIINGEDTILGAETGSGKTFAYMIPILEQCAAATIENPLRGMILAPTSELCNQIMKMIDPLVKSIDGGRNHVVIGIELNNSFHFVPS
jgi:superfamily II DNA/RNA helicase